MKKTFDFYNTFYSRQEIILNLKLFENLFLSLLKYFCHQSLSKYFSMLVNSKIFFGVYCFENILWQFLLRKCLSIWNSTCRFEYTFWHLFLGKWLFSSCFLIWKYFWHLSLWKVFFLTHIISKKVFLALVALKCFAAFRFENIFWPCCF